MNAEEKDRFLQSRAYVVLEPITFLRISGEDRQTVLNSLCTADLRKLEPGEARESFITDVRGKCIGHGIIFSGVDEAFFFVGIGNQSAALLPHFDKYVIREDMRVEDLSPSVELIILSGNCPDNLPEPLRPTTEPDSNTPELMHATSHPYVAGSHTSYLVDGRWTSDRDRLLIQGRDEIELVREALAEADCVAVDAANYQLARIRYGWPHHGTDFDATNLPQEVDRDAFAISFTKGCYLGQETVARLDALGQVQKKLVTWEVDTSDIPEAGTPLQANEKAVGTVRSAAWDAEQNRVLALVMTRRSHFSPGSVATCNGADAKVVDRA